jgi:mRNA interferase RelE/StbE
MQYAIIIKPTAVKSLDKLPRPVRRRILDALEELRTNPRPAGCVKLTGDENLWRIRLGDYRVVYEIHDNLLVVLVLSIGNRKDIYSKRR